MNRRLVAVFVFALVVASLTSFAVYRLIVLQMGRPSPILASNKMLVASHDLQVGELLHDSDVVETPWGGSVPEHAITNRQELAGRGVVEAIYQNEPILERRLAIKGAGAGLAATIPVGMRAVALRVNEVVGLAGFVMPGMRVDVLIAGQSPGGDPGLTGTVCKTVLQNIEVLSAGQKIEKSAEGKPESAEVVNLLVTPAQAETLNLASDETRVQLVLRNPLDTQEEKTAGTSVAALFGSPVRAAAAPRPAVAVPRAAAPRETDTIEIFNGVKRSEQILEPPHGK